ncbi:MAG: CocE/NonD family hydrolase [Chloroflexi bacterium]|nr:CocE/NonD family hydrolase [Chloroflexota bacterium]
MSVASRVFSVVARLPRARTHRVRVERDLRAIMVDGTELLADRYVAEGTATNRPIVLMRSPYGRGGLNGMLARVFAEQGYQAVVQSCRGTSGSGGTFEPLRDERRDGLATLDWLSAQPWFGGSVAMAGASYLGFTQWAVAAEAPAVLKALAIQVSASDFREVIHLGGSFALDANLTWAEATARASDRGLQRLIALLRGRHRLEVAMRHLPLRDTDLAAAGRHVDFYQTWLEHADPEDPYWREVNHSRRLAEVAMPVTLLSGWYDLFLPRQLADYKALRAAGRTVRLTVGPWKHVAAGNMLVGARESLAWFDEHLRGNTPRRPMASVRVYIMGARRWRALPAWPPPAVATSWYLGAGGRLAPQSPSDSPPSRYRYDPADPTPTVGGVVLGRHAGSRDNRQLEARSDVLTFTSAVLDADLEIIGPVGAALHIRSNLDYTDVFVRLCDVEPGGRSINVCDGVRRVAPGTHRPDPDGVFTVAVALWPTAYRFRRGHRLRLQVSSGAHPRVARNVGSGEPLATGTSLRVAQQEVFHDRMHPSAVILPVTAPRTRRHASG